MNIPSYMDRQSADYYRTEAAHQASVRHFYMTEARDAKDAGDVNGVDFNVGMAECASWRVRFCKSRLRKLERHLANLVTCDTCGKQAEREDAEDAGWLFYEEAECDVCLEDRKREAFREFRRDNGPGEYEAAQRAKYPGIVP